MPEFNFSALYQNADLFMIEICNHVLYVEQFF